MSEGTKDSGDTGSNFENQDFDPFSTPTPTETITFGIIKSFSLEYTSVEGSEVIFLKDAQASEIPNGSKLLIQSDSPFRSEVLTVVGYNTDQSFSILNPTSNSYPSSNTTVDLVFVPNQKFSENTSCEVIFDYVDLYDFSVGYNKTYTFNFSSREAFDQFDFLNYGDHEVTKSFPTITLKTSARGVDTTSTANNTFFYKTYNKYGTVTLSDTCDSCDNLNFEIFTSNDDIKYFNEVKKYLTNCGNSTLTKEVLDVRVLDCSCESNYTYLVTYCCDLSKDISTDYCTITWEAKCIDPSTSEIDLSTPKLSCKAYNIVFDKWIYDSSAEKLVYNRKVHLCGNGCTSYDVNPTLFIEPSPPTQAEWESCACNAPTPTITNTHSASQTPQSWGSLHDLDLIQNVHLAGDAPHFYNNSSLCGVSEVITKPNSDDLDNRVFYKETKNGYFYEEFARVVRDDSSGTSVNGNKIFLRVETDEEKASIDKGLRNENHLVFSILYGGDLKSSNHTPNNYLSIVDYSNPPPTPTISSNSNLIKDECLFYKVYDKGFQEDVNNLKNTIIAQLNSKYWFEDLPKLVYGKDNWYLGLSNDDLPSFEIIEDQNNLNVGTFNFEFNKTKVQPSFHGGNLLSDNCSLIIIKNLPSNFSYENVNNPHFSFNYKDPIFNTTMVTGSPFLDLTVEYKFNPKSDLISSSYSSLTYPIVRKEKVKIFINPNVSRAIEPYPYNYGKDKSFGITRPVFNLVKGFGTRL